MKRPLLAALALGLFACGGSDGSEFLANGDDGGGGLSSSSSGGTGVPFGQGQDGGTAGDANATGQPPPPRRDGGTTPPPPPPGDAGNPGTIACGTTTCPATGQCCVAADGTGTCQAQGTTCTGAILRCDDPTDCGGEALCCFMPSGTTITSVCTKDCNGDNGSRVPACTSTQQCSSCATHACGDGGVSVKTCAPIPGVCP